MLSSFKFNWLILIESFIKIPSIYVPSSLTVIDFNWPYWVASNPQLIVVYIPFLPPKSPGEVNVPTSILQNAKTKDEEEEKKDKDEKSDSEKSEDNTEDYEEKKKKSKCSLEQEFAELQTKFAALQAENAELLAFKQKVEEKEKDELIASFYMLSDEDKKDVIENKAKYSLKEIKAELSIICVDKKVNFNLENASSVEEAPVTFNLNSHQADNLPAWLKAVEDTRNRNK